MIELSSELSSSGILEREDFIRREEAGEDSNKFTNANIELKHQPTVERNSDSNGKLGSDRKYRSNHTTEKIRCEDFRWHGEERPT